VSVSDTFDITVANTNDAAVIGDPTSSTVAEDRNVVSGKLVAAGTISVTDVDTGDVGFQAGVLPGSLGGQLSLAADGSYSYAISNTLAAVQDLGDGQKAYDAFTIRSADGTEKTISFTVNGANEVRIGTASNDTMIGTAAHETFFGSEGNDTINGGAGNDKLVGAAGADTLIGGLGNDAFIFYDPSESVGTRDRINDFTQGQDVVDLSWIDANSNLAGNQAFKWAGNNPGVMNYSVDWYQDTKKGVTIVQADVSGDGKVDFQLELLGRYTLTESDFLL
jgi:VCBS repeat-containing protein